MADKPARKSSLHPKHLPLFGPVFGEAFTELGDGECCGFFAVEDGFNDVRGEVDQTQRPEEEGSFLLDFLCQFGNSRHLARFQHITVLKTLYDRFLQGGHGFRIKFSRFCLRLMDDRFAAIVFQLDWNGHFDIAVDQSFNCFFHLRSPFQL